MKSLVWLNAAKSIRGTNLLNHSWCDEKISTFCAKWLERCKVGLIQFTWLNCLKGTFLAMDAPIGCPSETLQSNSLSRPKSWNRNLLQAKNSFTSSCVPFQYKVEVWTLRCSFWTSGWKFEIFWTSRHKNVSIRNGLEMQFQCFLGASIW